MLSKSYNESHKWIHNGSANSCQTYLRRSEGLLHQNQKQKTIQKTNQNGKIQNMKTISFRRNKGTGISYQLLDKK